MKNSKLKLTALAALSLCALALNSLADPPSNSVEPRNSVLLPLTQITFTNGQSTNINAFTNIVLTAAYQHKMSVTVVLNATNAVAGGTNSVGSGTASVTNLFDVAKVLNTPSNGTNVCSTNWTTTTPLSVVATLNGLTPVVQSFVISDTNFDGFDLIRLTKIQPGWTNSYWEELILGQTP